MTTWNIQGLFFMLRQYILGKHPPHSFLYWICIHALQPSGFCYPGHLPTVSHAGTPILIQWQNSCQNICRLCFWLLSITRAVSLQAVGLVRCYIQVYPTVSLQGQTFNIFTEAELTQWRLKIRSFHLKKKNEFMADMKITNS